MAASAHWLLTPAPHVCLHLVHSGFARWLVNNKDVCSGWLQRLLQVTQFCVSYFLQLVLSVAHAFGGAGGCGTVSHQPPSPALLVCVHLIHTD